MPYSCYVWWNRFEWFPDNERLLFCYPVESRDNKKISTVAILNFKTKSLFKLNITSLVDASITPDGRYIYYLPNGIDIYYVNRVKIYDVNRNSDLGEIVISHFSEIYDIKCIGNGEFICCGKVRFIPMGEVCYIKVKLPSLKILKIISLKKFSLFLDTIPPHIFIRKRNV